MLFFNKEEQAIKAEVLIRIQESTDGLTLPITHYGNPKLTRAQILEIVWSRIIEFVGENADLKARILNTVNEYRRSTNLYINDRQWQAPKDFGYDWLAAKNIIKFIIDTLPQGCLVKPDVILYLMLENHSESLLFAGGFELVRLLHDPEEGVYTKINLAMQQRLQFLPNGNCLYCETHRIKNTYTLNQNRPESEWLLSKSIKPYIACLTVQSTIHCVSEGGINKINNTLSKVGIQVYDRAAYQQIFSPQQSSCMKPWCC